MSKEVKRYELRIVDRYAGDGTGDIETDARMKQEAKGRYVLFSDYDALLAERDRLREALERFYSTNQARLKLLSREAYLDMQRLPGMRDALYEMDDAQHQAYAALQGAQP